MLNPSFNQSLVFVCVAVITGAPFYFRYWVAKNSAQPAEVDRMVSLLTSIIFVSLFMGAFLFSASSRASGEILLAAAVISFSILYRSRWSHLSGRTPVKTKIPVSGRAIVGKFIFLAALGAIALICSRFPLAAPLFVLAFPFLAPYSLRIQHPCQKMAASDLKQDLIAIFENAGLKLHEVYLIDSGQTQFTNAMLARRTLFLTVNLFEQLTEVELKAVVYHEAAHLKKNHIWKRLLSALAYLFLGLFWAVLPICLWLPGNIAAGTGAVFLAIAIQLFFLGRKIYLQELEADAEAVEMGASSEALISALAKLSPGNEKEISPWTRFIFGIYHPTRFERTQAILSCSESRESAVFPHKHYFSAYSLFVLGFLFYSAQNFEVPVSRTPATAASETVNIAHSEAVSSSR